MKRYDKYDYYDLAISYGFLRLALKKCCRNVRWKDSIVGYELHAARNTHRLHEDLKNGTYKISPYQHFKIYEPKERDIVATRIRDRQVQMALCMAGLYRDITEHFIYDNCACQLGKGTDFAHIRLKSHLRQFYRKHGTNGYVLKLDVKKFFPSTRHDVAKAAVNKHVSDPRAAEFVCNVVDSFGGDTGIGLGSQISQLVELAVLDDLDHFIKEELKITHYVRYMDDMILVHEDEAYLKYCWREIEKKLNELHLRLNEKSTLYPLSQGVVFLKWRFIFSSTGKLHMLVNKETSGKMRRRLKRILIKEINGEYSEGTADRSLDAWLANADRGNTFYQQQRMIQYYERMKGEVYELYKRRTAA